MGIEKSVMLKQLADALKGSGQQVSCITNELEVIPTGFPGLDYDVMKCGGLPRGRIIEIYGQAGSGKSALAQRVIGIAQKMFPDKFAGLIDSEATYLRDWMQQNGVDIDLLQYKQTNLQEDAFKTALDWTETGKFSVVVIDSLANLMPAKMAGNEWYTYDSKTSMVKSDYAVGVFAKLTTEFCKKVVMPAANTNTLVIIVNQVRADIGGFSRPGMPPPVTTPGGHAFGHDLTNRIVLSKVEDIEENKEIIGFKSRARMRKSKVGTGDGTTDDASHLAFYFQDGIAKTEVYSVFDAAVRNGILLKSGAWYMWTYEGESFGKWQGTAKAQAHFLDDRDELDKLRKQVEIVKNVAHTGKLENLSIPIVED